MGDGIRIFIAHKAVLNNEPRSFQVQINVSTMSSMLQRQDMLIAPRRRRTEEAAPAAETPSTCKQPGLTQNETREAQTHNLVVPGGNPRPQFHGQTSQEREIKNENGTGEGKKRVRNFGLPTLLGLTLLGHHPPGPPLFLGLGFHTPRGPTLLGPHPSGPFNFGMKLILDETVIG